jgi:hypothetical protein
MMAALGQDAKDVDLAFTFRHHPLGVRVSPNVVAPPKLVCTVALHIANRCQAPVSQSIGRKNIRISLRDSTAADQSKIHCICHR